MKQVLILLSLFAVNAYSATATLVWDAVTNATSYRVYRSLDGGPFDRNTDVVAPTTSLPLLLTTNATRWFVTALGPNWETLPSNIVTNSPTVTPPPVAPPAPTNLRAQQVQGNRLDIGWVSVLTASTEVEASVDGGPWQKIATVPPGTLHLTTQIRKQSDYRFRVRAVDSFGVSGYSNQIIVSSR